MNPRPAPEDIVWDLQTTADKIRALARYGRGEIAKFLSIRYQHVRHVLVRSGVMGGLRREAEAEREPVEVDAAPAPREDTAWTVFSRFPQTRPPISESLKDGKQSWRRTD